MLEYAQSVIHTNISVLHTIITLYVWSDNNIIMAKGIYGEKRCVDMPINSFDNYPMSWKPKLDKSKKPLYLELARQLEDDIRQGVLLPGTKLPPQRELADYLDICFTTVTRVFKLCIQKGLLSSRVGSGTFVSYSAWSCFRMLPQDEEHKAIDLGSLSPVDVSYQALHDLLEQMLNEKNYNNFFHYNSQKTFNRYRFEAAKVIGKMGFDTNPENILPAAGGQNALTAILAANFKDGDSIGVDTLTYPGVKSAANLLGIRLVPLYQKNGEIDEEQLLKDYHKEHLKGIYVMPAFQNPTTHMMSEDCKKMLADLAIKNNLLIIEDGIFNLFASKGWRTIASYAPDNTAFIASFSKAVAPGLRIAFVAIPQMLYAKLADALYSINLTLPRIMVELTCRMLASEHYRKILKEQIKVVQQRNSLVDKTLKGWNVQGSKSSLFRWLVLPTNCPATNFKQALSVNGVEVYEADRFAVGNNKPINAVRLAIATPKTTEELQQALNIIKVVLHKFS